MRDLISCTNGPAGNDHHQEADEDDRDADRAGGDGGHELMLETPAIDNAPEDTNDDDDDDDREEKLAASE